MKVYTRRTSKVEKDGLRKDGARFRYIEVDHLVPVKPKWTESDSEMDGVTRTPTTPSSGSPQTPPFRVNENVNCHVVQPDEHLRTPDGASSTARMAEYTSRLVEEGTAAERANTRLWGIRAMKKRTEGEVPISGFAHEICSTLETIDDGLRGVRVVAREILASQKKIASVERNIELVDQDISFL